MNHKIHHLAVWVLVVIHFFIGLGWYALFGEAWLNYNARTMTDIEAEENIGIIQHPQPVEGAARNALLLLSIDRRERPAKIFPGARFYFDEDERVVVATHDVDLTAASPFEVTIKNFVALPPQEAGGQFLAVSAAPEMLRLR
jgi:hypothetical protein